MSENKLRVKGVTTPPTYPPQFITTWKTDNTSASSTANNQIRIDTNYGTHNLTINWGDGTTETITGYGYPTIQHTYSTPGTYTIKMSGEFPGVRPGIDRLKLIEIKNWGTKSWTTMVSAFDGCTNLTITAQDIPDFSNCTRMDAMFRNCSSITEIPKINFWDTSNVTNTNSMLSGCIGLTSLNLSGWDLSKVTMFAYSQGMLQGCTNLISIDVSNWILNTTSNYTFQQLFYACTNLSTIIGLETWNTSKCTNMGGMFLGCNNLTELDLSSWDVSSVTSMNTMFAYCAKLTNIDLSGWDLSSCTNLSYMFRQSGTVTVDVSNWEFNLTSPVSLAWMFYSNPKLTTLTGINTWTSTSRISDMSLFLFGTKIGSLDLSGLDLSGCISFNQFLSYSPITSINLSGVTLSTTSNVDMSAMFAECSYLTSVNGLETLNTSKVTSIGGLFKNCISLPNVNISGWDLSSCTNLSYAFYRCGTNVNNNNIDVTDVIINTSANVNMTWMFAVIYLSNITGLDTWDVSNVTNFIYFLGSTTIPTEEYSDMLIAWNALDLVNGIAFNGGGSKYNSNGQTARTSIITNDSWTFTDGGLLA